MDVEQKAQIVEKAQAIARPFHEIADRKFQTQLRNLKSKEHSWTQVGLSDTLDASAGQYVSSRVEVATRALGRVLESQNVCCTEDDIKELLGAVVPAFAAMESFAYQRSNSIGFGAGPGFRIAMEDGLRLTLEIERGALELLASRKDRLEPRTGTPTSGPVGEAPAFLRLGADVAFSQQLQDLWVEATTCYAAGANLATVVMLGSLLEGILLAKVRQEIAADSALAQTPAVRDPEKLNLAALIDVASGQQWIHKTRSQFSDVLRNYRNFVHPGRASQAGHSIDQGTASICLQVVTECMRDLGVLGVGL
jgi:hypothetical protein